MREELAEIPGAVLFRPRIHQDFRGFFLEVFREDGFGSHFVQANHSHSRAGVLRGLHYHLRQSDAWYVVAGRAQVALADLRDRSRPRPAVVTLELSGENPAVLYIPPGVAHGFLALTELDLIYWVTHYYDGSDELGVAWNDPLLGVPWKLPGGLEEPILSDRDRAAPRLSWGPGPRAI